MGTLVGGLLCRPNGSMGSTGFLPPKNLNASKGELVLKRCTRGGDVGDLDGVEGADDVREAGAAMDDGES